MSLTKKQVAKALKNSIKDGAAYSAMDGITSTYSTPFALALGANNAEIGLLSSIPNFFITLSQPFTGKFIEKRSRKIVCQSLSLVQRLIWLPIILMPFFFGKVWLFIVLVTLSSVSLSFANTAWSSWIGNLVPESIRGRYFGKRNTIQSVFSFSTTLIAGWILGFMNNLFGFSVIFFLAFIFGLFSYFYLTRIPEASYKSEHESKSLSVLDILRDFRKYSNFYPFTLHMSLFSFAVNIASPFFTVYMLSIMHIGYEWYAIVVATELLIRIFLHRYWGKLSDRFGDRTIMTLCNILIVFYPFFFLFVTNPFQLILISIFSGIVWSGFDLTTFNYLLDVTPPEKRPSYIANYKFIVGISLFLGPLIGGLLSQCFVNMTILWLSGLQIIFLLSFILRGITTAYGIPKLKEVRAKRVLPVSNVFLKAFAVYPVRGITHELFYIQHRFRYFERKIEKRLRIKK